MKKLKLFFLATRPPFLLLSVVLVLLGGGIAKLSGDWHAGRFLLCMAGLVLLHTSTNVLNDYFDFRSGIDKLTIRTPFSGGTPFQKEGALTPRETLVIGVTALALALPIGAYFFLKLGPWVLGYFIPGAIMVILGTSVFGRVGFGLGEIIAGLGLGLLPVHGTACLIAGRLDWSLLYPAVPSFFLTLNLLLLNEVPDVVADTKGGRRTIPIVLGSGRAVAIFGLSSAAALLWILIGVLSGLMPAYALASFAALPLILKSFKAARLWREQKRLVEALAANVGFILVSQLFLACGYFFTAYINR